MKRSFRLIAIMMVLVLSLSAFTACKNGGSSGTGLEVEDGEDSGVETISVNIANLTGKDASALYFRYSDSKDGTLTENQISNGVFHTNNAVPMSFTKPDEARLFDIRLEFVDGTTQDFMKLDLIAANGTTVKLDSNVAAE